MLQLTVHSNILLSAFCTLEDTGCVRLRIAFACIADLLRNLHVCQLLLKDIQLDRC